MTAGTKSLTEQPAWKALRAHYDKIHSLHLRKLFADDPGRGEHMTAEAAGIYLDYSKNRITAETLRLLLDLAGQPTCAPGSMLCSAAKRSTSLSGELCCTLPCVHREERP